MLGACDYSSHSFQIKSLQFHKVSSFFHPPSLSCCTQLDITPPPTSDFTWIHATSTHTVENILGNYIQKVDSNVVLLHSAKRVWEVKGKEVFYQ